MLINLFRSGLEPKEIIYLLIIYIFALTLSFAIHEFMHAAVAVWLGDPTPRNMGRLTLNPLAHLDVFGTILLLTVGFGWGKPVMYNPSNLNRFKNRRWMNIMVHLAGVTGNFMVAIVSSILASLFYHLYLGSFTGAIYILKALCDLFTYTYAFSMMLLAFNLLPIPPLDGFHVLEECLPYRLRYSNGYLQFQRYSPMILMAIFLVGSISNVSLLSLIINIIEWPFDKIIGLILIPFEALFSLIGI
ncbi:Zn-dependent protease [Ruminococcaceae bacterium R-25]|nr:Zn-dependent protease [Ruminococcaceae bacterium R-25]SUQ11133.1 Zn-dependent protease (includes SpoIVFB) [Oscillospiraceae bacterium]